MDGSAEPAEVDETKPRQGDFASAVALWVAEMAVSVIPLLAYGVIHHWAILPEVLARCQMTNGQPAGCRAINDEPDAEICILAVVISGLSLLPLTHRPRAVPLDPFRVIAAAGLLALVLTAGVLYALISAGISRDTQTVYGGFSLGPLSDRCCLRSIGRQGHRAFCSFSSTLFDARIDSD